MVNRPASPPTSIGSAVRIGKNTAVVMSEPVARRCGLRPGSKVRLVLLPDELRIRHFAAPRAYDGECLEEYWDRCERRDASDDTAAD
jgi:hypothetical protein